jgi:hypothetical protein
MIERQRESSTEESEGMIEEKERDFTKRRVRVSRGPSRERK